MNFWMRWVSFQALREMLLLAKAHPAKLRAKDLVRLATEKRILLSRDGDPLGPTTHYHHRRTLERLGLLVKRQGRFAINDQIPETRVLTARTTSDDGLNDREKEAFSNVVLRNEDCRDIFFQWFLPPKATVQSVRDFIKLAHPIELNVVQSENGAQQGCQQDANSSGKQEHVAIRPTKAAEWLKYSGTNAIQAIHFGLRAWGVDQLHFLDSLYNHGKVYNIFAKHIVPELSARELSDCMLDLLRFEGDWTTVRVGDFALEVGTKLRVSIEQAKRVLTYWIANYPDLVAAIPTNERFIAGGLSAGQRALVLKGFLGERDGAYVSHLRIHRRLRYRAHTEVKF